MTLIVPPSGDFLVLELFGILTNLVGSFCPNCKSITFHRLSTGPALPATWVCLYHSCTPAVMAQPNEPASAADDPLVALTTSLKHWCQINQPPTSKHPPLTGTTSDHYDKFKLFCESTESWFYLQAIPDEPNDKGAHLEYILNFLSTTGCLKWNQWTLASVTAYDIAATKKSMKSFLEYLASKMDHTVSQQWWIYQLEDVWIKPGETPDELVDHLRALGNRCNFPTDEQKEWNIQFHLVCAITDSELLKKLLTLDLKATTAKMLKTCRTHIARVDNLYTMGLWSKTVNALNKESQWPQSHPQ